jgi:hypothetical protein
MDNTTQDEPKSSLCQCSHPDMVVTPTGKYCGKCGGELPTIYEPDMAIEGYETPMQIRASLGI